MAEMARTNSHASIKKPDKPPRPTLFEAYRGGMLNEQKLRELADKIDRINEDSPASATKPNPPSPHGGSDSETPGEASGEAPGIPRGQPGVSLLPQLVVSPHGPPHDVPGGMSGVSPSILSDGIPH